MEKELIKAPKWRSLAFIFQLLRAEQWVKNFFLFIPAFFGARLLDPTVFFRTLIGFTLFSLIASAVYIVNDLFDVQYDRRHPEKRFRPIAARQLTPTQAQYVVFALLVPSLLASYLLHQVFWMYGLIYFCINLLYSWKLKHIAIIDISIIALGFLLRVAAGGAISALPISNWLIVLTFLLALILGLGKRRAEYLVEIKGQSIRKALEGYNLPFLESAISVCSTVFVVAYLMYCFSEEVTARIGSDKIYFTAYFVILGTLRYLQLAFVFNQTASPTRTLLSDRFLQLTLLAWVLSFIWLLYIKP